MRRFRSPCRLRFGTVRGECSGLRADSPCSEGHERYREGVLLVVMKPATPLAKSSKDFVREMKMSKSHKQQARQRKSRGAGATTPGRVNRNGQKVIGNTGRRGHSNQWIHQLECQRCGYEYGANGYDCHHRKCPACQKARPGHPLL